MFVKNYPNMAKSARQCGKFFFVMSVLLAVAKVAVGKEVDLHVRYVFEEIVRTPSDHRDRYTQVSVYKSGDVAFRYRDDVHGCTDKIVHEMNISNEHAAKITKEEKAHMAEALLKANVFDLASDPMPPRFFDVRPMPDPACHGDLEVSIGGRKKRIEFYTCPTNSDRAAVHKIIIDFVKRFKLDQPPSDSRAITVSEGDLKPAQSVQLAELLANPGKHHGKRISIVGYHHLKFEGNRVCIDKHASEAFDFSKCIWSGGVSTLVNSGRFAKQNDTVQEIEGVFNRGPAGHFGRWPGSIERITKTKIITK